jgi:hypothetical protein
MKQQTLEICERLMDYHIEYTSEGSVKAPKYHAQFKGKPGYWGCGRTRAEAVGNLVMSHPALFGVVLSFLEGKLPR